MRRLLASACGLLVTSFVLAGPAAAQPSDDELIEIRDDFLDTVASLAGTDPTFDDLIGPPGEYDLPPGVAQFFGLEAVQVADTLPDAGGSELVGPCKGIAASLAPSGDGYVVIDVAADFDDAGPPIDLLGDEGAQAFTATNPFRVDVDGIVVYAGFTDFAPIEHRWYIDTQGISLDSGGDPNPREKDRNAGSVDLGATLPPPAKVNALFRIEGEMRAENGFYCHGAGYFRTEGGLPLLEGIGVVLFLTAGVGALFNARPAKTWRGGPPPGGSV